MCSGTKQRIGYRPTLREVKWERTTLARHVSSSDRSSPAHHPLSVYATAREELARSVLLTTVAFQWTATLVVRRVVGGSSQYRITCTRSLVWRLTSRLRRERTQAILSSFGSDPMPTKVEVNETCIKVRMREEDTLWSSSHFRHGLKAHMM